MTKKNNVHSYNSRTSTNAKNNVTATTQELPQMTKTQSNVYSYNSRTDKNTCNVYNYTDYKTVLRGVDGQHQYVYLLNNAHEEESPCRLKTG